ncbi:MAG: lipoyl(octanoyl) transferase LipB [Myxococcota bacterium]
MADVDCQNGAEKRRSDSLSIEWLGKVSYADALVLQHEAVADRLAGRTADRLLLLEHPAVVTLGRSANPAHLKVDKARLRELGVELFEVGRGGDVTYHAPGQLVGYPIIDLAALGRRDVHAHLRSLETGLISALDELGVAARRVPGWTGVFVDQVGPSQSIRRERKLASIGIGVRRWVTFHGFALNVTTDLQGFDAIVPCGLRDVEMTSVALEMARDEGVRQLNPAWHSALDVRVREVVGRCMQKHLGRGSG